MATKFRLRNTTTFPDSPTPLGQYRDIVTAAFTAGQSILTLVTAPDGNGERQWGNSATVPITFYSERLDAEVTISGTITFVMWTTCPATFTGRLRARLWKVTAGGSNVESLLCVADATADMVGTASTKYTFTATPTSTTVAPGERFVVRLYVTPVLGSFGTGSPLGAYNEETDASSGSTWFEVTETVTVRPNAVVLHTRRTAVNGIGNFFDLLTALGGSAATTGVVNTSAGGTQIQWTRTAGGTVLEWITPRMKWPGWNFPTTAFLQGGSIFCHESNLAANCGVRLRLYRREPDGTETLVYTNASAELTTVTTGQTIGAGTLTPTVFHEDDRLVLRAFIINVGTMAAGHTCTLTYDHNVNAASGDSFITLLSAPAFKAEGDPAGPQASPSNMMLGGVGN